MLRPSSILSCVVLLVATSVFSQSVGTSGNTSRLLRDLLHVAAPPPPPIETEASKHIERPREFFFDKNVPSDDAPIEDILEYWAQHNARFDIFRHHLAPTETVLRRILNAGKQDPKKYANFLSFFPPNSEYSDAVLQAYLDKTNSVDDFNDNRVRQWLVRNTTHFKKELIRESTRVRENGDYLQFEEPLRDLARVDWESARPLLERLLNNSQEPASRIFAMWMFYRHAYETNDSDASENYREQLKTIVENKNIPIPQRDLAMDALATTGPWSGRTDWYISLLEDETLLTLQDNRFTGLTTLVMHDRSVNWTEIMLRLVSSSNFTVRTVAARNLMKLYADDNTEILKALIPWLSNPGWAKESGDLERNTLIRALAGADVPESAEGLAWVIANEKPPRNYSDETESEREHDSRLLENQRIAISAIVRYRYAGAVPALRNLLGKVNAQRDRILLIDALFSCDGYSIVEQVNAVEALAILKLTPQGEEKIERISNFENEHYYEPDENLEELLPNEIILGKLLSDEEEVSDELIRALFERLKTLRKTNPDVATIIYQIMQKWQSKIVDLELLSRLQNGKADAEVVVNLLGRREEVRKRIPEELSSMLSAKGATRGVASVLRDDPDTLLAVLRGDDVEAKIAMLGCARLVRAKLPVKEVSAFIVSQDPTLALAAERYLESEDSAESRGYVLAKHPNEALILGAREAFVPKDKFSVNAELMQKLFASVNGGNYLDRDSARLTKVEDSLRKEVRDENSLLGIYAFVNEGNPDYRVMRIFKNRVLLTWYEDVARYREYQVDEESFTRIRELISREKIDEFPPSTVSGGFYSPITRELLFIGRSGGRRVAFADQDFAAPPVQELYRMFLSISSGENFKIHYHLSETLKGLIIHHADDVKPALTLWKNGTDFRVLISDNEKRAAQQEKMEREFRERQKAMEDAMRNDLGDDDVIVSNSASGAANAAAKAAAAAANAAEAAVLNDPAVRARSAELQLKQANEWKLRFAQREFAHINWRALSDGKIGAEVLQPEQVPALQRSILSGQSVIVPNEPLNTRAGNIEVTAQFGPVFKKAGNADPILIREGSYQNPIISADGKWVAAISRDYEKGTSKLVRINLASGREYEVVPPRSSNLNPITFVSAHNKFLLEKTPKEIPEPDEHPTLAPFDAPSATTSTNENYSASDFRIGTDTASDLSTKVLRPTEFYFLDPVAGILTRARGDFRAFRPITFRQLQPTGNPLEFWAAIPIGNKTEIGRYDLKTLRFKNVLTVPHISFNSMDMWVDETDQRAFFVYKGHVLSVPLK